MVGKRKSFNLRASTRPFGSHRVSNKLLLFSNINSPSDLPDRSEPNRVPLGFNDQNNNHNNNILGVSSRRGAKA